MRGNARGEADASASSTVVEEAASPRLYGAAGEASGVVEGARDCEGDTRAPVGVFEVSLDLVLPTYGLSTEASRALASNLLRTAETCEAAWPPSSLIAPAGVPSTSGLGAAAVVGVVGPLLFSAAEEAIEEKDPRSPPLPPPLPILSEMMRRCLLGRICFTNSRDSSSRWD